MAVTSSSHPRVVSGLPRGESWAPAQPLSPIMVGAGAAPIPRSDPTGPTGVLALGVPEGAEESHSEA